MIRLHKIRGEEIWINPDLIAYVEGGSDTRVQFLDGHHLVVQEDPEAVAAIVRRWRQEILAVAFRMEVVDTSATIEGFDEGPLERHLQSVPPQER